MHTPCPRIPMLVNAFAIGVLCLGVLAGGAANGQQVNAAEPQVQMPLQGEALQARVEQQRAERTARSNALRDLVGDHTGAYLFPDRALFEQIFTAAGIPDAADGASGWKRALPGGYTLYAGCRQHNCPEKGAILSDDTGTVVRAALISFKCDASCEQERTLTIFKRASDSHDAADAMLDGLIRDWADSRSPGVPHEVVELR